jgi:hypothetical protein
MRFTGFAKPRPPLFTHAVPSMMGRQYRELWHIACDTTAAWRKAAWAWREKFIACDQERRYLLDKLNRVRLELED